MKKSAFTLIELLVVIAIIAILAALAIPALTGSIEKARALSDANQLKSMGTIMVRYLSERDDQFPSLTNTGGQSLPWPQALFKLVPDYKVFVSPFDKRAVNEGGNSPCSYGINSNCFDKNASDFATPSQLYVMGPVANSARKGGAPSFQGSMSTNVSMTVGNAAGIYKNGTMLNVLFADWHVTPTNYQTEFQDMSSNKGKRHWYPEAVQQ
jgi:prepilin-type N-terminal cleavage/methylation domain-containing protein/prepilin-type processing-associated H-X9-DG protein